MTDIDIISFILAFIVLYFSIHFLSKLRRHEVFKDRLQDLAQYKELLSQEPLTQKKIYRNPQEKQLSFLEKIIEALQKRSAKEQEDLHILFEKAGLRSSHAYMSYETAKVVMLFLPASIAGGIVFYFSNLDLIYKLVIILGAAFLGSYSVDFTLRSLVNNRQERIRKALPIAIDLLVICTEAGLSLVASVQRVAREVSQISPDLGYELALFSIELSMLADRKKAFQHFSDRLDAPYFKSVVANILQAEEYGTPIAQTMRVLAEQFRQDRLVEAEERAARLPTLLSLPMMIFIFPCIYIIIMGPAVINVLNFFK